MLTPKRPSMLGTPQSAKVTRSQSLKSKNELFSAAVNASGGLGSGVTAGSGVTPLGRISLTMNSIYNDPILESYKSPLPIRVNELIFQIKSQDSAQLNAHILPNGYVCLISERKAFIWKLKKSLKNVQCNELTLPYSKSSIKPNCMSIEAVPPPSGQQSKECVGMCVTNEGVVRYWPSISNEYMCAEAKFEPAAGDEVSHLLFIDIDSYLAVTANGNLWSIEIDYEEGKATPVCRQIDTSSGFISSVSRRMTSLIFGGGGTAGSGSLLRGGNGIPNLKACVRYKQANELYILVDKNLQKWRISPENNNSNNALSMLSQTNLEKLFYESYLEQNVNSTRIGITFHDCSITKHSVYVLATVEDVDEQRFVIGEIDTFARGQSETAPVSRLKSFNILNYEYKPSPQESLRGASNLHTIQYRLHAMDNQHAFYLCSSNTVVSFTGPTLELAGESRFNTLGDKIIASNHVDCGGADLVFFSVNHGILRSKDNSVRLSIDEENFSLGNQSLEQNNASFGAMQQHRSLGGLGDMSMNLSLGEDVSFSVRAARQGFDFTFHNMASADQLTFGLLKDSFQCYLKKEERQSQAMIDEILKTIAASEPNKLDSMCVDLSEKLIDDVPAHDPRWAELNATTKTSSSKSMNTNLIIGNQLRGKIRLHEYYLSFLKKLGIWERFSSLIYNGREIRTVLALQEHGEKLQLALTIREQLYSKNPEFINIAIDYITKTREEPNSKLIYPHDLFYRRVSKIDDIFNALYVIGKDVIDINSNEQAINYMIDTCYFFVKLLKVAQTYREEKFRLYEVQGAPVDGSSSIPTIRWTFLPLNEVISLTPSILSLCVKQHKLSSEYGLDNCNTLENKASIMQHLYDLDSLIFDEYEVRLRSYSGDRSRATSVEDTDYTNLKLNYDSLKTKLIDVFVKQKQVENALKLAEKYVDFSTLVLVCELRSDNDLLASYLDKFCENRSFAEFVVKYFMEKKKLSFLLNNQFLKRPDVSACLDKFKYLSWIKDFKNDNYSNASDTLFELAMAEKESFLKQKTLLSLSKLSLLADRRAPDLEERLAEVDHKLDYLHYIESQAGFISDMTGSLIDQIPYLNAEQLIDFYLKNPQANEIDFKKAFELIDYLNEDKAKIYSEDQIKQLKIEILVRTILSDNWEKLYDLDYPESSLCETKFFKTLCLLKDSDEDIESLIDSKNELLFHEMLSHLAKNKKFEYLLQACFEIVQSP